MMQIVGQPGLDIPLTGQLDQFEQLDHPGSGYRGNSLKHIQFLQKIKKSAQRGQASISKDIIANTVPILFNSHWSLSANGATVTYQRARLSSDITWMTGVAYLFSEYTEIAAKKE